MGFVHTQADEDGSFVRSCVLLSSFLPLQTGMLALFEALRAETTEQSIVYFMFLVFSCGRSIIWVEG